MTPTPDITIGLRWCPYTGAWDPYYEGTRVRGRKWVYGTQPRRFADPDKARAWAEKEVRAMLRAGTWEADA